MFFEALMLFCFGAAWPLSIYKTLKSDSLEGKPVTFLFVILFGYLSGIIYKWQYNYDPIIYLYFLNSLMVIFDITLTFFKRQKIQVEA